MHGKLDVQRKTGDLMTFPSNDKRRVEKDCFISMHLAVCAAHETKLQRRPHLRQCAF